MEAVAEEIRYRDRVSCNMRIATKPFRNDQPVDVGTKCQPRCGPERIGDAAPVGDARQAHQQPARHVRCLGAEGGDPGTERTASKIIVLGVLVCAFGKVHSDSDDDADIQRHRYEHLCRRTAHFIPLYEKIQSMSCTYDRTVNVHKACIPQLETGLVIGLWAGRALPALKTS